ncbi:MAG: carbamate kinase, partial [Candidatus Ornithospirochaeta sp.]
PQVGYILRRAELAQKQLHTVPLDSCVADTQGAIGYQLQMALDNQMAQEGIQKNIATVVTQVEVKADDPSFQKPTKPIGSFMTEADAMERKEKDGWSVVEDAGRGWRRVVASPKPVSIIELETIRCLLDNGVIVIAAGGGGITVVKDENGCLKGMEAVIDKDLAAAMLAKDLKADMFVISTAVPKVCLNYGKSDEKKLDVISTDEAKEYIKQGHFAPGSMLPKIQALVDFVDSTGNVGIVTDPEHLYDAVYKDQGTKIKN